MKTRFWPLLLSVCATVLAGDILPAKIYFGAKDTDFDFPAVYERGATVRGELVPATPLVDKQVELQLRLTDSYGRQLLERKQTAAVANGRIPFSLTPTNVVAMVHVLTVRAAAGDAVHFGRATIVFKPLPGWDDYVVVNWHRPPVAKIAGNWAIGVRGSTWFGRIPAPPYHFIRNNFRYYTEGTGHTIFSAYHLWRPHQDLSVYYRIDKEDYSRGGQGLLAWQRSPSLADPFIHEQIFKLFHNAVRTNNLARPYFYTVGDEPGIANQAAPSDYDFSPWARKAFRDWLDRKYGDAGTVPLQPEDIYDWPRFLRTIQTRPGPQIWARLPPALQTRIKAGDNPELRHQVVAAINEILKSKTFFDRKHWRHAHLPEEAQDLLHRGLETLSPQELQRFNRLALQAAMPHLVSRSVRVLDRVNRQWDTEFKDWRRLRALTTDETFARKGDNFSPWCDHKDFMDDLQIIVGYGRARRAVKSTDPTALIGAGGLQGPTAVGGWDYWKLTRVLDVLEAYPIGNNYELIRSFNPGAIQMNGAGAYNDGAKASLWYRLFHGSRGTFIWDRINGEPVVGDDNRPTERGRNLGRVFNEMEAGIARQIIVSQRDDDPIAIYESQPSLRTHWCLDVRPLGKNWIRRDSWNERRNVTTYRLRASLITLIEDCGLQFKMLSDQQVKRGDLAVYDPKTGSGFKILVLPRVIAMSAAEAEAIRAFINNGGTVIAEGVPATFDEHGRRRRKPLLADLFPAAGPLRDVLFIRAKGKKRDLNLNVINYHRQRLVPEQGNAARNVFKELLTTILGNDRKAPVVVDARGEPVPGVEIITWKNGSGRFLAVHRNRQYFIKDMAGGDAAYQNAKRFDVPVKLTLENIRGPLYDVRAAGQIHAKGSYSFTLDPYEPTILAVFVKPVPPFAFKQAENYVPGEALKLELTPPAAFAKPVYRITVTNPAGQDVPLYARNIVAAGTTRVAIPIAAGDPAGRWTITAREVLTGRTLSVKVVK